MNPYFQFSGGIISALLFLVALFFLFVFLPVSMVAEAFSKLGLTPVQGVLMLIAIMVGRMVNIPVHTSERLVVVSRPRSVQFGMDEAGRPVRIEQESANELKKQVFAVNVGGFVLPLLLSITFLIRQHMVFQSDGVYSWIGFVLIMVAGGCYAMAKSDPVTGIRIPLVLPRADYFSVRLFLCPGAVQARGRICGRDNGGDPRWQPDPARVQAVSEFRGDTHGHYRRSRHFRRSIRGGYFVRSAGLISTRSKHVRYNDHFEFDRWRHVRRNHFPVCQGLHLAGRGCGYFGCGGWSACRFPSPGRWRVTAGFVRELVAGRGR